MARSLLQLAVFSLSMAVVSTVGAAPAVVDHFKGIVEKRDSTSAVWNRISPGEKMSDGDSLRTQDASEADLTTGRGHHFHLKALTTLVLTHLGDDNTETRLEQGRVVSTVKHLKSNEQFSIQTPTAVCAVRGTEFETGATERETVVAVFKGTVGVSLPSGASETAVHAGQMTSVHDGLIDLPRRIPRASRASAESALSRTARHEVGLDMTRNQVIASAAMERRSADYQEGKSLIDAAGHRVRVEEYIVRPAPDTFKFVALNERGETQLDYFFYQGKFNKALPTDLSVALKDLSPSIGSTAPDYFLTGYEMGQSNTQDSIHDTGTGGHLVKVTLDNSGTFTLADPSNLSNTLTVPNAQLQSGGTYKVYNPLTDSYSIVTAAQKDASTKFGVYIPENDTFRDLEPGDTIWKTSFNTYDHSIDHITKINYAANSGVPNVLNTTLQAHYTYAGGFVIPTVQPDANNVDSLVTNTYGDGTIEQYRTVLIDNLGNPAPLSAFSGISSGAAYNNELLRWNYEQQVSATEFQGRKIDLVVEPRIFILSGLIQ